MCFGLEFEEVAAAIGARRRRPAAKLAHRRRAAMSARRGPRFKVEKNSVALALCRGVFSPHPAAGDMKALGAMLAADVSLHADGGGKRPAAREPVFGFEAVMKVHEYLAGLFPEECIETRACGFRQRIARFHHAGGGRRTFHDPRSKSKNGKVTAIYVVRNPDKLRHLH